MDIVGGVPGHGDAAGFRRMFELPVAALLLDNHPTILSASVPPRETARSAILRGPV